MLKDLIFGIPYLDGRSDKEIEALFLEFLRERVS